MESDFFALLLRSLFKKLTPASGMTSDYKKLIDSCSCLTPITIYVQCKQPLRSLNHCAKKSLRVLFQSKISTPNHDPLLLNNTNACRSRLLYSGSCPSLV